MKVAIFAPYDFNKIDGNTIRPLHQCQGLWSLGFKDFTLYCKEPDLNQPFEQIKISSGLLSKVPNTLRPSNIGYLFELPILQKMKFPEDTIIHAHNFYSYYLIKNNAITISDLHTFKSNEILATYKNPKNGSATKRYIYKNHLSRLVRKLEHRIMNNATRVIVPSGNVRKAMESSIGRSLDNISVSHNLLKPEKISENKYLSDFSLGVVGGFKDTINREVLFEAARKMPLIKCPVIIIGSMYEEDKALFEDFPNVRFSGRLSDEDYANCLAEIGALWAPYPTFRNGGGTRNKLMEAAAAGTPIICTKGGAEGFENEKLLSVYDSDAALQKSIEQLKEQDSRKTIGRDLVSYGMETYDYKKVAQKLIDLYSELSKAKK